jgi:hypothetical protein
MKTAGEKLQNLSRAIVVINEILDMTLENYAREIVAILRCAMGQHFVKEYHVGDYDNPMAICITVGEDYGASEIGTVSGSDLIEEGYREIDTVLVEVLDQVGAWSPMVGIWIYGSRLLSPLEQGAFALKVRQHLDNICPCEKQNNERRV